MTAGKLVTAWVVAGIAMPAVAQNLYVPAPFPDPPVRESQPPGIAQASQPEPLLDRVPLPPARPRTLPRGDTASASTALPATPPGPVAAEPTTTGRAQTGPVSSAPGQYVRIINNTAVAVTAVSLVPAKRPGPPHPLVANLSPFNATNVPLPPGRGCLFAVHGTFANGAPLAIDNVDLCHDPLINITVW